MTQTPPDPRLTVASETPSSCSKLACTVAAQSLQWRPRMQNSWRTGPVDVSGEAPSRFSTGSLPYVLQRGLMEGEEDVGEHVCRLLLGIEYRNSSLPLSDAFHEPLGNHVLEITAGRFDV